MIVIAALHDLTLVGFRCDRTYVIAGGAIAAGAPERGPALEVISQVFAPGAASGHGPAIPDLRPTGAHDDIDAY